jgi:hypothetical protein
MQNGQYIKHSAMKVFQSTIGPLPFKRINAGSGSGSGLSLLFRDHKKEDPGGHGRRNISKMFNNMASRVFCLYLTTIEIFYLVYK